MKNSYTFICERIKNGVGRGESLLVRVGKGRKEVIIKTKQRRIEFESQIKYWAQRNREVSFYRFRLSSDILNSNLNEHSYRFLSSTFSQSIALLHYAKGIFILSSLKFSALTVISFFNFIIIIIIVISWDFGVWYTCFENIVWMNFAFQCAMIKVLRPRHISCYKFSVLRVTCRNSL